PTLDIDALERIRKMQQPGRESILHKVLKLYLDGTPELLEKMQTACAEADAQSLRGFAHSLKSSSANLGALSVSTQCQNIELSSGRGELAGMEQLIQQLKADYLIVEQALKAILSSEAELSS
ncbi:MAG: Hpt domain-containing protein, partial [Gammaproteobacteria bacterium]